jgi:hypothetical protein
LYDNHNIREDIEAFLNKAIAIKRAVNATKLLFSPRDFHLPLLRRRRSGMKLKNHICIPRCASAQIG